MNIKYILLFIGLILMCHCGKKAEITQTEESQVQKDDQSLMDRSIPTDSLLKEQLESIRIEDQTLRFLLPEVNKKFGADSEEREYIGRLLQQQDSICEQTVLKILDKHGWLSAERVGYMANQAQWLVIQHAPIKTQEQYLPMLKKSVKEGGSEGWYLAFLEDRILKRNGKEQLYGSQAEPNAITGKTHIYSIQDVLNVNKRRAALGLETIETYAEKNRYVFDIKEHL